jgi:uncharacterized protein YggT (Ycf19 family)
MRTSLLMSRASRFTCQHGAACNLRATRGGWNRRNPTMTYEEERVVTHTDDSVVSPPAQSVESTTVRRRGSPVATLERLVIFIFGLIQALIVMRIVLLLLAAREANPIVSFVYDLSELFVAPFRGMFAMDTVPAGQAALDVAAIVALVGWTIIELLIIALLRVFRPAAAA